VRSSLIRLGWSHLTVVAAGLATVLAVVWITFMPSVEQFYALEFALPRLQQRYGFQFGKVKFSRDNVTFEWEGILSVEPAGELGRMGVRRHGVPFAHHGNGAAAFYHALIAAERAHVAEFDVLNADGRSAGRDQQTFRTIRVPSRSTAR
jgi:hypothetical protein